MAYVWLREDDTRWPPQWEPTSHENHMLAAAFFVWTASACMMALFAVAYVGMRLAMRRRGLTPDDAERRAALLRRSEDEESDDNEALVADVVGRSKSAIA